MRKGSEYWLKHVAAIKREGLSTNAYAKEHGLAAKRLYYWQRKAGVAVPSVEKQTSAFIALRVESTVGTPAPNCTLILSSGLRLEMSVLPAPSWLVALNQASQGAHGCIRVARSNRSTCAGSP